MSMGQVPSVVASNAYNWNLDCSKKVELGKSFRPPHDYEDDNDFEKSLD
jgi:hypothetical protein